MHWTQPTIRRFMQMLNGFDFWSALGFDVVIKGNQIKDLTGTQERSCRCQVTDGGRKCSFRFFTEEL